MSESGKAKLCLKEGRKEETSLSDWIDCVACRSEEEEVLVSHN